MNGYNFEDALRAEPERAARRRIPRTARPLEGLFYRQVAQYEEQVRRYIDTFGRDRAFIGLYEDLQANPEQLFRDLMAFLELPLEVLPEFRVFNVSKQPRSATLKR